MSTPQHPFQANTDKDSLLSFLIPVVEEEKARLPADRRFRTMTPNSEWADVILIRLWFTNMLGIEMCTASNCGFFSSLCYDCLPLPFRVSSSMWILRVRTLNNTRQLINPHWVMNLFCFSAGRLSFSKQECGCFFLFFFFLGRWPFKSNPSLPRETMRSTSMKTLSPAQYHNIQRDNHDNLTITPYSYKVPFISQSVFLPHP